jgi:hypothetical protein
MQLNKYFILIALVSLASCGEQDRHMEKGESKSDSKSVTKEETSICGADWEGDHGDLIFPGLVTLEECERLCEPIYEELLENQGSGYCQFGAERIWEYPFYQE